jgi:hypothetical protein
MRNLGLKLHIKITSVAAHIWYLGPASATSYVQSRTNRLPPGSGAADCPRREIAVTRRRTFARGASEEDPFAELAGRPFSAVKVCDVRVSFGGRSKDATLRGEATAASAPRTAVHSDPSAFWTSNQRPSLS